MQKQSGLFLSLAFFMAGLHVPAFASERQFAGAVSSASPEATAAGVEILEKGGNAIDAAIAVSLALGVSEPAGSGIGGQTVMLVQPKDAEPFIIHGTTWSPRMVPDGVKRDQLTGGRTASTVPSTLRVLDLAYTRYGSGNIAWADLVAPAARAASEGFVVGPFRHRSFRFYGDGLKRQPAAAETYVRPDGTPYQIGDIVRQPLLAATLARIAQAGAMDFYTGEIAAEIAADMAENGGWITAEDLAEFPEPAIVPPIRTTYRGYEVVTLPPPFGGWVVLQILNLLEQMPPQMLAEDNDRRRLGLLDALSLAHGERASRPVSSFTDYDAEISDKVSKEQARKLLDAYARQAGGETTHFSVVDSEGTAVAVTQSIDSYFGSKVVHPSLGFFYNNYMQSFRLEDDGSPYVLKPFEMPYSSMSATIVKENGQPKLVLGSPGSARIISAVAQTVSHWVDVKQGVEAAVSAYRVHALPQSRVYIEGPGVGKDLLAGMVSRGFELRRPRYGVSDSHLDPYFGGVHALALDNGAWVGAADPRRDGRVGYAWLTAEFVGK